MSIFDPRCFNIIIVLMFCAAALRWAWSGNWPQFAYWSAAAALNVAVMFMAKP